MADTDNIIVNGNVIVFPDTKNKRPLTLHAGEDPRVGDIIGIHPHQLDKDKNQYITHGLNNFEVGDEVVIRKLRGSKDEAAFKPGYKGMYGCINVDVGTSTDHIENEDGTKKGYTYIIEFNEPFLREDHDLNIYMKFNVAMGEGSMQFWYPYGGVWAGFSSDNDTWYYCPAGGDPFLTIRGLPAHDCGDIDGQRWCFPDALNVNGCNSDPELGGNCGAAVPPGLEINYMLVHISVASSLFWSQTTETDLSSLTVCRGKPTEVDPCPRMAGDQKCES